MKKLIIMAFAGTLCVVVNAAAVSWETGNISAYTVDNGYSIYAFDTSAYALETAISDFKSGSLDLTKGFAGEIDGADAMGIVSGYEAKDPVNMFLVVLNDATAPDANYAYFSSVMKDVIPDSGVAPSLTFDMSGSATPDNWVTTPEPTSGLLLLLGLGVMALRRKRA